MEEGVIYVLREYLNQAEGLYRSISAKTKRCEDDICEAVEAFRVKHSERLQDKSATALTIEEICSSLLIEFKKAAIWNKSTKEEEKT